VLVKVRGGTFTSLTGHIAGRQVSSHVDEDPHDFCDRVLDLCAERGEAMCVVTGLPRTDEQWLLRSEQPPITEP